MLGLVMLVAAAVSGSPDPETADYSMVLAGEVCPRVYDGTIKDALQLRARFDEESRLASLNLRQKHQLMRDCDMYLVGKVHAVLEASQR